MIYLGRIWAVTGFRSYVYYDNVVNKSVGNYLDYSRDQRGILTTELPDSLPCGSLPFLFTILFFMI